MDIWVLKTTTNGTWLVNQLDSGRADAEGIAQWLAENTNVLVFFGTLSEDI